MVRGLRPRAGRHEHRYLERSASLTYLTQHWLAVLRAQNFQTIDDIGIPPELRPHTIAPQLAVHADFPNQLADWSSVWTWRSATSRTTTKTG
jgi:hypothetical protein